MAPLVGRSAYTCPTATVNVARSVVTVGDRGVAVAVMLIARFDGDVDQLRQAYDRAHALIMSRGSATGVGELRHHCAIGEGALYLIGGVGVGGARPLPVDQRGVRRRADLCWLPVAEAIPATCDENVLAACSFVEHAFRACTASSMITVQSS